jgi:hypothetical protein
MSVPGSNLLKRAAKLIAQQSMDWYKFIGETENAIGNSISSYDPPVAIEGSMQPLERGKYDQFGLDFNKTYFLLYTSSPILGAGRDYAGDYAVYNGVRYFVEDVTDWYQADGWMGSILMSQAELYNA